jgi:hypothetical protein
MYGYGLLFFGMIHGSNDYGHLRCFNSGTVIAEDYMAAI